MAADTPFGLSFGNPRMYMGQSPLAEVGKAAKTGLMLYGLQKSGAIEALDKMGVKPNAQGGFGFSTPKNTPAGAVAPVVPSINQQAAVMPSDFGAQPIAPPEDQSMQPKDSAGARPGVVVTPVPEVNYAPPAPDAGSQILNGTFRPQSSVDLTNKTDFNPSAQQVGYNQMLATGNEYQQVPGYGKIAKTLQTMFGMG
jgi:hypothetical protein